MTSWRWANWNALWDCKAAQPEIRELARMIIEAIDPSHPVKLHPGEWHLPYIDPMDGRPAFDWLRNEQKITPTEELVLDDLKKVSVPRCARVSYFTHGGRPTTFAEDIDLYARLMVEEPLHASPAEHQATPDECFYVETGKGRVREWLNPELHGNLTGWQQLRKMMPGEYIADEWELQ